MVGPLDLVYSGWVEDVFCEMDICEWVVALQDKLMLLHDIASANEFSTIESRVESFNKHKSERSLSMGDLILLRVPGMHTALSAAWEGPYVVTAQVSRVTYKLKRREGDHVRVAHINNTKVYKEKLMASVSVVAEGDAEMEKWVEKSILGDEKCEDYHESDVAVLLERHRRVFSVSPGLCTTGECKIVLKDDHKVVNIPPRNVPVHIHPQVEAEINKMLKAGIIER